MGNKARLTVQCRWTNFQWKMPGLCHPNENQRVGASWKNTFFLWIYGTFVKHLISSYHEPSAVLWWLYSVKKCKQGRYFTMQNGHISLIRFASYKFPRKTGYQKVFRTTFDVRTKTRTKTCYENSWFIWKLSLNLQTVFSICQSLIIRLSASSLSNLAGATKCLFIHGIILWSGTKYNSAVPWWVFVLKFAYNTACEKILSRISNASVYSPYYIATMYYLAKEVNLNYIMLTHHIEFDVYITISNCVKFLF